MPPVCAVVGHSLHDLSLLWRAFHVTTTTTIITIISRCRDDAPPSPPPLIDRRTDRRSYCPLIFSLVAWARVQEIYIMRISLSSLRIATATKSKLTQRPTHHFQYHPLQSKNMYILTANVLSVSFLCISCIPTRLLLNRGDFTKR